MNKNTQEIVNDIASLNFNAADFLVILEEKCAELNSIENPIEAIEPLLRLLEKNPDVDFGSPGPIVHFLERFYKRGYEDFLVESVSRSPTELTVWMINRILNALAADEKPAYLAALREVEKKNVSQATKDAAVHFLSLHVNQ